MKIRDILYAEFKKFNRHKNPPPSQTGPIGPVSIPKYTPVCTGLAYLASLHDQRSCARSSDRQHTLYSLYALYDACASTLKTADVGLLVCLAVLIGQAFAL